MDSVQIDCIWNGVGKVGYMVEELKMQGFDFDGNRLTEVVADTLPVIPAPKFWITFSPKKDTVRTIRIVR
jgi:hypothetical protein